MEGVFVIGTDTGVGKTTICAGILKMLYGSVPVQYWKPVQTGTIVGDDTKEIQTLTGLPSSCFMEPAYRFAEPLAPEHAAKKWNKTIDMDSILSVYRGRPSKGTLIIEGAGGILVPFTQKALQVDLVKAIGLPTVIVAEDRLGAINHTLLTIRECNRMGVSVAGVVLTRSSENFGNKESIEEFGGVKVLAQIPTWEDCTGLVGKVSRDSRLRGLFGLPPVTA